jgi:hypothetical protein
MISSEYRSAAMLGEHDRVLLERAGHRQQRRRLHERHVGRQDQPAGCAGALGHAGGDRGAHAARRCLGRKHDDVAPRELAGGQRLQRLGSDQHHRELGLDRMAQRRAEDRGPAERLLELVHGGIEAAAAAGSHHDDGGTKSHGAGGQRAGAPPSISLARSRMGAASGTGQWDHHLRRSP